jgi:hypothetical protein
MPLSLNRWTVAATLVLLLIVTGMARVLNNSASAQALGAPGSVGRYQISAYAGPAGGGGVHHGCYIIDTATGQVWHTQSGGTAEKVSSNLQ